MPRFDPQGRILSGVGSGVVAIGGVPIARGGVANWLKPGVAIFQNADDDCLYTYDANHPQPTLVKVAPSGANVLAAGGGHWIAWLFGRGLYSAAGVIDPTGRLAGVNIEQDGRGAASPDGHIAITNSECVGFTIVGPNGAATLTMPDATALSMQVLGARTAVWVDERHQPRAVGLPNPAIPPFDLFAIRTIEVGGTRYVLGGTHSGLVLYPWNDASAGWRFDGLAFYPSIRQVGPSELEISFALGAGELPSDLATWRIDVLRTPKVAFSAPAPDPTPTPPTHPPAQPPTQPSREPAMPDVPAALHNQLALVTEVRNTLFPNMVGKPLNDPKKAFAITKNVAWRLRAHGVGLVKAKQGSDNNVEGFTSDIVALANGVHWDVLVDGNEGAAFPNWAMEENPANYPPIAARWVPALDPRGTPAPDPVPAPDQRNLKALIAAEVARAIAPLQAEIAALKTKIEQERPWPASGTTVRLALKSAHGKYVSIQPDGRIVADRADVGGWEILEGEPQ